MIFLGIESSCDETAAAVLENGHVRSNCIATQIEHIKYGGVVPELASRAHISKIVDVVQAALESSGYTVDDVEAVAVTQGPGLVGSLLVGLTFAKAIALSKKLPLIAINHLEGHLYSAMMENPELKPPFICMIASGGHSILALVREINKIEILGQTRDDAAGEAFDKVAKILDLPYPGGPEIEKMALKGKPDHHTFPVARLKGNQFDFSFSGLKTAVLYYSKSLSLQEKEHLRPDICASFQNAVIKALKNNIILAMEQTGVRQVAFAGGVAQNKTMCGELREAVINKGGAFFSPGAAYCTDNAAMIAYAAHLTHRYREPSPDNIRALPNLNLG